MKSLVVTEQKKQINDNGTELKLASSQIKKECEYIATKEISLKAVKVTIDKDTFKSAMGGTLSSSYYYFQYLDNKWDLYGGAENVNLADYGITLDGDVVEDDRIYVYCDTVENVVTSTRYDQTLTVYRGANNEKFNYINIFCDVPNVYFSIGAGTSYINTIYSGVQYKTDSFFVNDYTAAQITAYLSGYFDETTIKIIVAKVKKWNYLKH